MEQFIQLKEEISNFIRDNLYPQPDLNETTTLEETINMLNQVIRQREQQLTEEGVYHDDWPDDEILGQALEYKDVLIQKNQEQNIEFTKNVSLVTRKGRTPTESKLPPIPDIIEKKIKSYGVEEPNNADPEFAKIKKLGGKSRRYRKKSRKTKRKTRKQRKQRKQRRIYKK
jgi:hypothetical protein